MKKPYRKPELKTRKVQLGVFGDYGDGEGGPIDRLPVDLIKDLDLHME